MHASDGLVKIFEAFIDALYSSWGARKQRRQEPGSTLSPGWQCSAQLRHALHATPQVTKVLGHADAALHPFIC